MKYDVRTMLTLVTLFLISQLVGLGILYKDAQLKIGPTGEKDENLPVEDVLEDLSR